ncbi:protein cab-1 isoform X2 [Leguminivora glycinivorella]|uniref:protein cab-1 isoform X2 n=1 Tax=Leguminivora glycinivorella TaxID=1035111 RepID=UPI00200E928C|nr:protein cab-1 isoform X2 [Leguminivora glycinivorella]
MPTQLVLALLAATAACALARPPEPTPPRVVALEAAPRGPLRQRVPIPESREYLLPRFLLPHFLGYDDSPRMPPPPQRTLPDHDWLNKEIDRINQMSSESDSFMRPYDDDLAHWIARDPYLQRMFENPVRTVPRQKLIPESMNEADETREIPRQMLTPSIHKIKGLSKRPEKPTDDTDDRKSFALTPLDKGYFEPDLNAKSQQEEVVVDTGSIQEPLAAMVKEPPRQTRQNPNLSRTKTLVTENIDKLRSGLNGHEEGLMGEKGRENIHVLEASSNDPIDPLLFAAVGGAIAAAVSLTIFGFTFAWYTLAKKAKAAADVDYPAYGVTGPTVDSSGDRKLAHSAHMYHYQHQKQQIIAMENRIDLEQRLGSVSEPESEEENEEGDYTVYECPGFATTGDMEVKNPLFSDDPTPATPGKCDVVKPQPKD